MNPSSERGQRTQGSYSRERGYRVRVSGSRERHLRFRTRRSRVRDHSDGGRSNEGHHGERHHTGTGRKEK